MKYALKNKNYYTFETFEINKLPPRAYFIPFSEKENALVADVTQARYVSDLVTCLSGEWDFCFFKDPKKLGEVFDTDAAAFDKISVPSVWQYTGYLDPMYLCTYLPFRFDPPKIPKEKQIGLFTLAKNNPVTYYAGGHYNSVGVYRKKFFIGDINKTHTLSFLGVCASLDLFINGQFVGYSEGAHNTAEFRIDEFVAEGENELVAVVHRFSNGSYLETQDMFRNSGIFRDVLLYSTEKKHIFDYAFETKKEGDTYTLTCSVWVQNADKGDEVDLRFLGENHTAKCDRNGKADFILKDLKVDEWSAEIPNLYTATLSFMDREFVCEDIGFRHMEIIKDVFFFNGKNLKILGVDHHDTDPVKGWTMYAEDMERDVRLMKDYNVNAVRTSHYPPDPMFVRLCRKYGLYLIEEADIETHCAHASRNLSYISRDKKWQEHYLDRVKRMYGRDRNLCNVILWSLGNESGGLTCQKYCYDYLKTVTDTPVHYEWCGAEDRVGFDVLSEMYTPIEEMKKRAAKRFTDERRMKPYFLCEYAHAMGVGPGALEDYVELFLSEDVYMGGCIWEWADHSVYHPENGNYTYGGDHNDYIVDKTFCIDGLFTPNRKPYTSAFLMKAAYRPIRAKYLGDGKVEFRNVNRFRSSSYLLITASFFVDGRTEPETELSLDVAPDGREVVAFDAPAGKDVFLNLTYRDKATGKEVATEQVVFAETVPAFTAEADQGVSLEQKDGKIVVSMPQSTIVFDRKTAGILSYTVGGKELISAPQNRLRAHGVYQELARAPFCNDRTVKKRWKRQGLFRYRIGRVKCLVSEQNGIKKIVFSYLLKNGLLPIGRVVDVYSFAKNDKVFVENTFTPFIKTMLPKSGKTFEFKYDFQKVRYYGRGERESYPDMKVHTRIGVFEKDGDFGEKMIVPQNSGERCDVRWAEVTDEMGIGVRFDANGGFFGLNVNHYHENDVMHWKHIVDYRDRDATYVCVDGFLCGAGSASCGPLPEPKYRIPEKTPLTYRFVISPIVR